MRPETTARQKEAASEYLRSVGEPEPKPDDGWNIIPLNEMFAPLPPYPWLIEGLHMAPGRLTLLAGYANSGKTIVAQNIALSVMTGEPLWRRHAPARKGRVLHLNGEIGSYIAKKRYQRLARGMSYRDFSGIVASGNLTFANYPRIALDDRDFEKRLADICVGHELVIVDSLRAFSGDLDENSKAIGTSLFMFARVSERTGSTFLVLHHTRKSTPGFQPTNMSEMIAGSSSILGAAECAYVIAGGKGEPLVVHHERSPLGKPNKEFGLKFRDITMNGDREWGLRLDALDEGDLEEEQEQAESRRVIAKNTKELRSSGGRLFEVVSNAPEQTFAGSRKDLKMAVGGSTAAFDRAFNKAIQEGLLVKGGDYHSPTFALNPSVPVSSVLDPSSSDPE